MEERFQKQIQRIRKLSKLKNDMYEEQQNEIELEKKIIKDRQEQEVKRFYEHVQKNFMEYILNLFEHYTSKYGNIERIEFHESRLISAASKQITKKLSDLHTFQDKTYYLENYHWPYLYVIPEHYEREMLNTELKFSTLYSDYLPKEDFAHVIIPNSEDYNSYYIKFAEPSIILCINNLEQLFKAVSVNYECTSHYYNGILTESESTTTEYCDLGNEMSIELHMTTRNFEEDEDMRSLTVSLIEQ